MKNEQFPTFSSFLLKPISEPTALEEEVDNTPRIFENFYILGCEKIDFAEFDLDPSIKEGIVPAKILFKFNAQKGLVDNPYEYIIHEFAHPFGLKAEKLRSSDAFEKLGEYLI